jgi:hypothetical protein
MATVPASWARGATRINPLEQVYGGSSSDGPSDRFLMNNYNQALQGFIGDKWTGGAPDDSSQGAFLAQDVQDWLDKNGYQLMSTQGAGIGGGDDKYQNIFWIQDSEGNLVAEPSFSRDDPNGVLKAVALAAGGYFGGSALAGAGAGGAGTTAATAGTTAGTTAAGGINWSAIGSAAAKSAALNGGMTLAQGGDLGDALKSAAMGAVTGGAGGYVSTLGMNPILAGAATGAVGSAARGGGGSDVLKAGLLGGASGALNQWQPTDSVAGNAALRSGAMTLASGGDLKQGLLNAATAGGGKLLDGAFSSGPQRVSASFGDNLDTSGYGTFTGGNALTFTPSAEGSTTVNDDFDWNTYDYPSGADPYEEALSGSTNVYATGVDPNEAFNTTGEPGPGTNWGDYLKNLLGSKNGKVTFAGVDFSGGDLLKLFTAGVGSAYNRRNAEKDNERNRQTVLDDRQDARDYADSIYARNRTDSLTDQNTLFDRQDAQYERTRADTVTDREEAIARQEAKELAARKRRAPVSAGLLMPQLVRRGP